MSAAGPSVLDPILEGIAINQLEIGQIDFIGEDLKDEIQCDDRLKNISVVVDGVEKRIFDDDDFNLVKTELHEKLQCDERLKRISVYLTMKGRYIIGAKDFNETKWRSLFNSNTNANTGDGNKKRNKKGRNQKHSKDDALKKCEYFYELITSTGVFREVMDLDFMCLYDLQDIKHELEQEQRREMKQTGVKTNTVAINLVNRCSKKKHEDEGYYINYRFYLERPPLEHRLYLPDSDSEEQQESTYLTKEKRAYKSAVSNNHQRIKFPDNKEKKTFRTPYRLATASARKLISMTINSKLNHSISKIEGVITNKLKDIAVGSWVKKVEAFARTFETQLEELCMVFNECPDCALSEIRNELKSHRKAYAVNGSGIMLLQLILDSELKFEDSLNLFLPILQNVPNSFKNIKKLCLDYNEKMPALVLDRLLCNCAHVVEIEGYYSCSFDSLIVIQSNCQNLVKLRLLPELNLEEFDCDKMCNIFFNGLSMNQVEDVFGNVKEDPSTSIVAFPHLEILSIMLIGNYYYRFFRMFLHFYTHIKYVDVVSTHSMSLDNPVSWFDCVVSDIVLINPKHSICHVDLNLYDLFLTFSPKVFKVWENLKVVSLHMGYHSNQKPSLKYKTMGVKLLGLCSASESITELNLRFIKHFTELEILQFLYPVLQHLGPNLTRLTIWDKLHSISHKTLVQILNFCPSLEQLMLIFKPTSKYQKEMKLNRLPKLEVLYTGWLTSHFTSKSPVAANFISDLLTQSPNLKKVNVAADEPVLEAMSKAKFGLNITHLVISYYKRRDSTDKVLFKKLLDKLPKLEVIKIVDLLTKEMEDLVSELCQNTEIAVKHCKLTDDIAFSCGSYTDSMCSSD